MRARMKNPALIVPGVMEALWGVAKALRASELPMKTINLVLIRASQINGCSFCLDMHNKEARRLGESEQRLWAVGAWRESPHFEPGERAALELTEYATRLSDRTGEPVPDDVYARAAEHFDEPQLAALIVNIAMINFWNRLNAVARVPAGTPLK
ncbi:MAG: carboxymuconolactone decarboxylase family protein [Polyangiales bacterium]